MKACIATVQGNKTAPDFIDGKMNTGILCVSSKDESQWDAEPGFELGYNTYHVGL